MQLEDKLESGLYCELTDKLLYDGYVESTLHYDMIANRISIEEVQAEKGSLRLMKNLVREYDALPHFLIFDEYVAFMECLNTKESIAVLSQLKQIVMLGRRAGYFLILACQKVLQYIMGHAHIDVTMEVYNQLGDRARIENEIAKLDSIAVNF